MLLKHEDNTKLRLLAAKANQLVAFGGHKNTVANRRGDVTERPHRCYPGEGQAAEKRQAEQEAATATTAAAPEGEVPHRPGYPEQGLSRTLLPGADTGGMRGWQSQPPPPRIHVQIHVQIHNPTISSKLTYTSPKWALQTYSCGPGGPSDGQ